MVLLQWALMHRTNHSPSILMGFIMNLSVVSCYARFIILNTDIHRAKNAQVDILQQSCYQQADIRMRLRGLRQLVDDKSVASCQQTYCELIVKPCHPQVYCMFS